jgi:hypothetical protein
MTCAAIERAGDEACAAALAEVAEALAEDAETALAVSEATAARHATHRLLVGPRMRLLAAAPSHAEGTLALALIALDGLGDWDGYAALLDGALRDPTTRPDRTLLMSINSLPDPALRQAFLARLADAMAEGAVELRGHAAAVHLSVLHLLGRRQEFKAAHARAADRLPRDASRFFARLRAAREGAPPPNRGWALGLSKTGTTSLNDYADRLGLLAAHWTNPALCRLLTREDADLFDLVSDTPIAFMARRDGLPPGRPAIVTTRGFEGWERSWLGHFRRMQNCPEPSFERLRDLFRRGGPCRFGQAWRDIHEELYFRFDSLREAYDAHRDWLERLGRAGVHVAELPLEADDKAARAAAFLAVQRADLPYPHANRAHPAVRPGGA